ncbi:hypothetical protein GCM10009554_63220 [Kribbella koreensis]|uniref:Lipoprotein LprG n=1 Tax=Kribbella koreensis TaxID=57909 RepID=A0ABP4BYE3_9ACTN
MKRILLPLVVAAAMMSTAACGGSDDPKPAGKADKPAAALSQADFATKVPAALQEKSTFHAVATTTDEDGPVVTTSDLKVTAAGTDLAATTDQGLTVLRIGGKFYGKGEGLSENNAKPWKVWDPTAGAKDPMAALTGVQLQIQSAAALTHQLLAGAAYATKFTSTEAPAADGASMTEYTITIDAPKAAAAKALGDYLTTAVVAAQKINEVTAVVLVDQNDLPHKLDFTFGTAKESVRFTEFGDPVSITAPPAALIDA